MVNNKRFNYIVRNSEGKSLKFFLNSNKTLCVEDFDNPLKKTFNLKEHVIDFSIDIDKSDIIHLLYLTSHGQIKYSIYNSNSEDKTLAAINLKSFSISNITLRIISSEVHVFYMLKEKVNSFNWGIYHSFWSKDSWKSSKLSDINSRQAFIPYKLDVNKNNVYILYSKDGGLSYSIKKYHVDYQIWSDYDDNLIIRPGSNINFFIDKNSIAMLWYYTINGKKNNLLLRYKDLNKKIPQWSHDILISSEITDISGTILLSNETATYAVWEEDSSLVYKESDLTPEKWSVKKTLSIKLTEINLYTYLSNYKSDDTFKSSGIYLCNSGIPLLPDTSFIHDSNSEVSTSDEAFVAINTDILSNISLKENYIRELQLLLIDKDKKILQFSKTNYELKNQISELNDTSAQNITKYKEELQAYSDKISALEDEKSLLVHELSMLKKDKEGSHEKLNMIVLSLKEKEANIERLNTVINNLYNENTHMSEEIETLQNKLNKGFFKFKK